MNLLRALTALGINAVPALGWFLGDWNSGTTLAVYWFETVLASLFIAARVLVHRKLVPLRGHFRYAMPESAKNRGSNATFLQHFLPVTLMFSVVHGIFLAAIFFVMTANGRGAEVRLNFHELFLGCGLILAFQVVGLLIDLVRMKVQPFRWVEVMAERNLGRVLIIHMTIMIGMVAGGLTGGARGFFLVFVILKTMNDLNGIVPQYDPEEAPKWLSWLMDKVPNIGKVKNQSFAEFWREGKKGERDRVAKNEQPFHKTLS